MSDMTSDQTVEHIDAALAAGDPWQGVDVGELASHLSTIFMATGSVLHLQSHDFVATEEVRPHVEMLVHSMGFILHQLSEEDE